MPFGTIPFNPLDPTNIINCATLTANAGNAGGTIVLAAAPGAPASAGGIYFGVTPGAGNHSILGNPGGSITINGPGAIDVKTTVQLDTIVTNQTTRQVLSKPQQMAKYTVATLPTGADGDTAYVTDASTTIILGLGTTVVGGGSNHVPVYFDGGSSTWKIG